MTDDLPVETPKQTGPDNPFSELVESAISMHEMYVSYVQAGFTRSEALELIARIIACYRTDSGDN